MRDGRDAGTKAFSVGVCVCGGGGGMRGCEAECVYVTTGG